MVRDKGRNRIADRMIRVLQETAPLKLIGGDTYYLRYLCTNAQRMGNKQDEFEILIWEGKYNLIHGHKNLVG